MPERNTITICLSTYNGAAFLGEQIDSIIAQTDRDWHLLIRDDGSTDPTVAIIEDYCARDNRIEFINRDDRRNLGIHRSFKALAGYETAELYLLCDQDDVWLPTKIAVLRAAARGAGPTPHLWYSDLTIVDANLNHLAERVKKLRPAYTAPGLKDALVHNPITGCSAMFNRALRDLWLAVDPWAYGPVTSLHDSTLGLLALVAGDLTFVDAPLLLYRQHGRNHVGVASRDSLRESLTLFWDYTTASWERCQLVLDQYAGHLAPEARRVLSDFRGLATAGIWRRLSTVARYRYSYGNPADTVLLAGLLLTRFGLRTPSSAAPRTH